MVTRVTLEWKVPSGRERPLVTTMYHCRFFGSAHKEKVCHCFPPIFEL